ncbi:hypothetical protein ACFL2Q_16245 [Thermodesulfobacteriota bacterium]
MPAQPWSKYFHFPVGSEFKVDGPGPYNGSGKLLERTNTFLKFDMHMPKLETPFNIPKSDLIFELTYKQEGAGNPCKFTHNGRVYSDANVTMKSGDDKRKIIPSVKIGKYKINEISLGPDGQKEIDLDIDVHDYGAWDFDLELED